MIDADILENYEAFLAAETAPRRRRGLLRRGALAASLVLLFGVGMWMFLPMGMWQGSENCLMLAVIDTGEFVMHYQGEDHHYRAEPMVLDLRRGALFWESDNGRYYKLKGRDDLRQLIYERHGTGELILLTFTSFAPNMPEQADTHTMPTLGEVWAMIYGAKCAEDISRVTFEQIHVSCEYERAISIPAVTLTDGEDLARFYENMAPLAYEKHLYNVQGVQCTSNEYLDGTTPLTVQTARRVVVEFASGETMKMDFYAADGVFHLWNSSGYAPPTDILAWLIDTADIDLAYRDHGTVKGPQKGEHEMPKDNPENETAVPPPAPLQTETEKPIDVGHMD